MGREYAGVGPQVSTKRRSAGHGRAVGHRHRKMSFLVKSGKRVIGRCDYHHVVLSNDRVGGNVYKKYAQDDDIWRIARKRRLPDSRCGREKGKRLRTTAAIIVICWKTLLLRLEKILALASHANRGVLAVKIDETHKYKNLCVPHRRSRTNTSRSRL